MLHHCDILQGARFTWVTDHKSLEHVLTQKGLSVTKHAGWRSYLSLTSTSNMFLGKRTSSWMHCLAYMNLMHLKQNMRQLNMLYMTRMYQLRCQIPWLFIQCRYWSGLRPLQSLLDEALVSQTCCVQWRYRKLHDDGLFLGQTGPSLCLSL